MSAAGPTSTLRTGMPLISIPRIEPATRSASSAERASFTPPAFPRPPTRTCALITTAAAPPATKRWAAARASAAVWATAQSGTGRPWATRSDFASASWIFTGGRAPRDVRGDADGTASHRPPVGDGTNHGVPLAILDERGQAGRATAEGREQQELVERARRGDHDAF